jgi:hypothetical protein
MLRAALAFVSFLLLVTPPVANASLESFLDSVNVQARADLPGFSMKVAAQFGVPVPQVEAVLGVVARPADAFMVFQLGQFAHRPPETVVQTYQTHRGKGWGVIAKELGVKPGSREFHALKKGNLVFDGVPAESRAKSKGNGKGNHK